jgi:hypothetical protein
MRRSLDAAGRLERQALAADLAVTLLSEVQMGLYPVADQGPTEYQEPALVGWSWEITAVPVETAPQMRQVTVVVTHTPPGASAPTLTHRLTQWLLVPPEPVETDEPAAPPEGGPA